MLDEPAERMFTDLDLIGLDDDDIVRLRARNMLAEGRAKLYVNPPLGQAILQAVKRLFKRSSTA